jgi:enoyl-[acyl-carrier protein] reductase I
MLSIDLRGKRALVAGVADDGGFGFAITRAFAQAGAEVCVASWPPAMGIFEKLLQRGRLDASMTLDDGSSFEFERIYPLDAAFDSMDQVPEETRENKRYQERGDFTIEGLRQNLESDFGSPCLDILVHSLANGPEVHKALIDTSREGYLAAIGTSAYSNISLIRTLGPLFRPGASTLSLTYMAGERAVPGYGGGMSSAKAALESDTRTLAWEAGRRFGVRVNTISAGVFASRAASAIGFVDRMLRYYRANAPIPEDLEAMEVGHTAAFLCSPLASAITGSTVYVDNGYHAMGAAMASPELEE